jgi:hypothetical protein
VPFRQTTAPPSIPPRVVQRHAALTALIEGLLTRRTLGPKKMRARIRQLLRLYKQVVLLEVDYPGLANW